MDHEDVDSILENANEEFLKAVADMIEATKQYNAGETSASAYYAAMENFVRKYEALKVACDNAEMLVNSAMQALACTSRVDIASHERSLQDPAVVDGDRECDQMVMDETQVKESDEASGDKEAVEVQMKESDDKEGDKDAVEVQVKASDEAEVDKEAVEVQVKEADDDKENVGGQVKENEEGGDDKENAVE